MIQYERLVEITKFAIKLFKDDKSVMECFTKELTDEEKDCLDIPREIEYLSEDDSKEFSSFPDWKEEG